jgi:hypothetical protein
VGFAHRYCGACGTHVIATSTHSSDRQFEGYVPYARLPIETIAATGHMTSADRCYCGACDTRAVPTSPNSSNGSSDISGPLLLPSTIAMGTLGINESSDIR